MKIIIHLPKVNSLIYMKIVFSFIAFTIMINAFGQNNPTIDSLENILRNAKEDTAKVKCLNELSRQHAKISEFRMSMQYAEDALELAKTLNYKKGVANSINIFGVDYYQQGNYPKALENLLAALKIYKEIGDNTGIAKAYANIGVVYDNLGNYPEALNNFFSALEIFKEIGGKKGIAIAYNNIGTVYDNHGSYEAALENYFASLEIYKEIGDKSGFATSYLNIGSVCMEQGDYHEANKYLQAALKIYEEIGSKRGIAFNYRTLGIVNLKLRNYRDARKYLNEGLAVSKKIGNKDIIKESYSALSILDSAEGNLTQAMEHYKMYALYKDSLLNEESNKHINQMKIQYETEMKDREIDLLNKDKALQEQQLEKQKLLRNGMFAGVFLIVLVGLLLFRSFRLRKKLEKQQAIIQERKRISADLHDDVGSGLSRIILLSELEKKEAKTAQASKGVEKIAKISSELASNIDEIVWALNSDNDYVENLVAYIRRFAVEYFENSPVRVTINSPVRLDHIPISGERRRNIFYTVKEALNNILKHAQATEAELGFRVKQNVLSVVIKDNGKGFSQGELNRFGNGLKNMKNRMKSINGDLGIENHSGTRITLSVPV